MERLNYKRIWAIKKENKDKILKTCPNCPERSGIYFLLREENGFKFAYIGQSKNILQRLADHLQGYQHIDLSIKKHGLYSQDNLTGWRIEFIEFPEELLDEKEQFFIKKYANEGFQLRNSTIGGQGKGKLGLDNSRHPKNYYDGLLQGYKNAQEEVSHLFKLHLDFIPKKIPPTANQQKAAQKFQDFLDENKLK